MSVSKLIYEPVNGQYGWGKYGEFKVLIRKSDGYINATKLCKEGGKELYNWNATEHAKQLINKVISSLGYPRDEVISIIVGGQELEIRGTYIHPLLIPHIASWISADFAIMVSEIVNGYLVKEYEEKLYQQDLELGKRKDKIDELLVEVKDLHQKLDLANENIIEAVRGVPSGQQWYPWCPDQT